MKQRWDVVQENFRKRWDLPSNWLDIKPFEKWKEEKQKLKNESIKEV